MSKKTTFHQLKFYVAGALAAAIALTPQTSVALDEFEIDTGHPNRKRCSQIAPPTDFVRIHPTMRITGIKRCYLTHVETFWPHRHGVDNGYYDVNGVIYRVIARRKKKDCDKFKYVWCR